MWHRHFLGSTGDLWKEQREPKALRMPRSLTWALRYLQQWIQDANAGA